MLYIMVLLSIILNIYKANPITTLVDDKKLLHHRFLQNKSSYQLRNEAMQLNQSLWHIIEMNRVNREKKFLNLFNVIKFKNIKCNAHQTTEKNILNGTCYHKYECESLGGISMGTCANGLGVCCIFIYICGGLTNQSISYFENPHYPMSSYDPFTCIFSITLQKNVQQLLLEFLTFELKRPTEGDCIEDQFLVTGQNRNFIIPVICGINTGEHIFIDVHNAAEDKIVLSVLGNDYGARAFSIRVSQLETKLAPEGCLQYYTGQNGIIKSFNYDDNVMYIEPGPGSYFNNLNYAICIQRASNMCKISYANENDDVDFPFELVNINEDTIFFTTCESDAEIVSCTDDFIALNSIRLCGGNLNTNRKFLEQHSVITDLSSGPIVLHFITNNKTVGVGFKLFYSQGGC